MNKFTPNTNLNEFRLLEFIGSGGSAEVWKAERDGDVYALKIYAPQSGMDAFGRSLFKQEFEKTSNLFHDHILTPLEYGEVDHSPYLVYPLCEGSLMGQLRDRMALGEKMTAYFSESEVATILIQIGGALEFLHANGVIHQDIKPENILYKRVDNKVHYYLTDFGISTRLRRTIIKQTRALTSTEFGLTPAYAAPEQFLGKLHAKSDIFALGITLYEILEGDVPIASGQLSIGQVLLNGGTFPIFGENLPQRLVDLLLALTRSEYKERPTPVEVYNAAVFYKENGYWPDLSGVPGTENVKTSKQILATSSFTMKMVYASIGIVLALGLALGGFYMLNNSEVKWSQAWDQGELESLYSELKENREELDIEWSNRALFIGDCLESGSIYEQVSQQFIVLKKDNLYGIADKENLKIIQPIFDRVTSGPDNSLVVQQGQKCGIIKHPIQSEINLKYSFCYQKTNGNWVFKD